MNAENVIGLIPAAGKGVRLNLPYPKELYPIIHENRYKPIAQFVVENMLAAGVHHIVFVVNETKHQLIGYFGSGSRFGCNFSYVVQEQSANGDSTSPGLAHALDSAFHLVKKRTVVFGMADTIIQPKNVFTHIQNVMQADDSIAFGLFPTSHPEKLGMVDVASDGSVLQIVDKPTHTQLKLAWGCIIWQPPFTDYLHNMVNEEKISDFAKILNGAIRNVPCARGVLVPDGTYADLGTYDEILELERRYHAY